MKIGVDFDNTIVCYDDLFHRVAHEHERIPITLSPTKSAIRDYLREIDKEDVWTQMQGEVYGLRMIDEASPFPGIRDFFVRCHQQNIPVCIISHKTHYPYQGERYDLHKAARQWLARHHFDVSIGIEAVFLELTKADKLARIAQAGCTHFIDDLPEFLSLPEFPAGVQRILFDPNDDHTPPPEIIKVTSWAKITEMVRQ